MGKHTGIPVPPEISLRGSTEATRGIHSVPTYATVLLPHRKLPTLLSTTHHVVRLRIAVMLLVVGGLMASIVMPTHAAPALALTLTTSAAQSLHKAIKRKPAPSTSTDLKPLETHNDDSVTLVWRDLSCRLEKKNSPSRLLLDRVSGAARPGRILAILGPSGAGKTTLLNSLASRIKASNFVSLSGAVLANGVSIDARPIPAAYVTQEDLFFSQLTVRETIDTAARLRLPGHMTRQERKQFIDSLLRRLALLDVAESRVGDTKTRGISGGERKRLSLACELISAPKLILCDEPTSGLDAFQAEKVMTSLKELAQAGHTVICSIHQPSSTIFRMFDDIVLLAGGQVVYAGESTAAPAFFAQAGHVMPVQVNPAERYLDLISVDYATDELTANSEARIASLVKAYNKYRYTIKEPFGDDLTNAAAVGATTDLTLRMPPRANLFSRIRVLLVRAWRQVVRDKKTNFSRFMSSLSSAMIFGSIYWRMGFTQTTIQDRLGLLQVCVINTAMSSLVKTLNVFPREATLVNRERSRGAYGVLEYFASKMCAEMPVSAFFPLVFSMSVYPMVGLSGGIARIARFMGLITLESFTAASYGLLVGAMFPNTETALAVGPASFVLQIVFGGLYITEKNVPRWASWIPRVSLIKHAYEGLCVNEFRGLEFETTRPWDVKKGEQVLQRLTWDESTVTKTSISQLRVLCFNYLATLLWLSLRKPRFEKLQPVAFEEIKEVDGVDEEQLISPAVDEVPLKKLADTPVVQELVDDDVKLTANGVAEKTSV